jgi:lipoic acid synthetase
VFGHNIETVARLHPLLRDVRYRYARSLEVLRVAAAWSRRHDLVVKSGFMVGHGETETEIRETLEDLLEAGCVAVSIGQYLCPTAGHRVVVEFISPERFKAYERLAYELGFAYAVAGPLVRSSYRSEELWPALAARHRPRAVGGRATH